MSDRMKKSFDININTNVDTQPIKKAEKELNNFFTKYGDKSLDLSVDKRSFIDGKDLFKAITSVKQLEEAIESVKRSAPMMMKALDTDVQFASNVRAEFEDVMAVFEDGNIVRGFDEVASKIANGFSVVAVDLGGRVEHLKTQITDAVAQLKSIGATQKLWGGMSFFNDDMSQNDLANRINQMKELISCQRELEAFSGQRFDASDSPLGATTSSVKAEVSHMERVLSELKRYNEQVEEQYQITTQQLARRKQLIDASTEDVSYWNDYDHNAAKKNVNDQEAYTASIEALREYISQKERLITQLQSEESQLFRADGIGEYVAQIRTHIDMYQGYIEELESLKKGSTPNAPIGGVDFSEVIQQLKEIKDAINSVKVAFEPLTNALSAEDNALHKMLTTSIEDLNTFESRLKEVYQMIDTISKKEFTSTTTNVISNGNTSSVQADLDLIRQLRKEASATYKQVEDLYSEALGGTSQALAKSGRMDMILEFQRVMSDFNLEDLSKRTKSRSAASLGIVSDELAEWKQILLQFNELRNKIEAGSFDASKYATKASVAVDKGTKVADGQTITESGLDENQDILNKVKTLSEQIETELTSIRAKIETTFDLSTVDLKTEHITSAIERISQQFTELQNKINALNLTLEVPATVAKLTDGTDGTKESVTSNIDNGDAATSASQISAEASAMQDVKTNAESAAQAKEKFANANKKVATTAQDTSDKVEEEAKKMEEAAGAIVEASNKVDKVKLVESADGTPVSKTTTSTETRANAIRTTSTYFTYDDDNNPIEQATTIVDDFKKRAADLKREADKIALAKKTVDKFLSQFESKTAGQASTIKGFDALKNFKIENLDDIEKATQAMLDLDNEYNKITKSFRQGTKSMNPFVNAVTGINEMENKIKEAEIAFGRLNTKPDELSNEVKALTPLFETMMSFLGTDENGNKVITDIYGMSKAYGELNSALRQVNSNIKIQKQIDTSKAKDVNFGLDLEKQLGALSKQQAQWKKSGQLTDEVRQKVDGMLDSLSKVTNSAELSAWKKQWSIVKDEVVTTKYETEAAGNAAQAQVATYEQILKAQEKLYNLKKKMVGLDPNSSKGQETMRKITEAQKEYNKALAQGKNLTLGQRTTFKQREAQQKSELSTLQQEYKSSVSTKQEKEDLEYILELYAKYTDAAKSIKKMQTSTDTTGAVHTAKEAAAIEEVKNAKAELLALGIDVNKISESEVLTEEQKNALLAEQLKYKKQIQNIENTASDKAATNNQKYGKTIYNREAKYFEGIDTKTKELSSSVGLSDGFTEQLERYKMAFKELQDLREQFANNPDAFNNAALKGKFQETALTVETLRKQILSTFNEAQKFEKISASGAMLGSMTIDTDNFKDAKAAMIGLAASVTDGKFQFEGFNAAGTEMYGTLSKGAGVTDKVTVKLREGTNQIYAYTSGTKQASNAWDKFGNTLKQSAARLVTMYLSLHDIIRYVRKGLTYVKEIDLAMTELRKVTDETEATYKNFLKTASSTSAVIGSTVSDFTDATAAFARLGYSIEESSKMAETAIVYKNVAD